MEPIIIPPALNQGDKIAIVSPSGKIDAEYVHGAEKRLREWGFSPVRSKHCLSENGRFASTAQNRAEDLISAVKNPDIKAILCSRGGYGAIHLTGYLDREIINANPKWLIGYSDITLLHAAFFNSGVASLHAPMAKHLAIEPEDDKALLSLRSVLSGNGVDYKIPAHPLNREGKSEGILYGGNLAVLYGMRGTPYDIPSENCILFIEDTGERPYQIERMFYNLKIGGILKRLSGLIIGQFSDYEEDKSLGKTVYEAIADIISEYDFPVCFNFPVGHVKQNMPMIIGTCSSLQVGSDNTKLEINNRTF